MAVAVAEGRSGSGTRDRSRAGLDVVVRALAASAIAFLLVLTVEAVVRGSVAPALNFAASRPGIATALLFALLSAALDALFARRHAGWLVIAPLSLLLAGIASQKANYLGDPLYPSDILYAGQIVELLPLLLRERPLAAMAIVVLAIVATAGFAYLWKHLRRRRSPLPVRGRIGRLAVAVPALVFATGMMDYATFSWTRDRLGIVPMMWDQKENYGHNGFTLAFALNAPMAKVVAPEGYSAATIEAASPPPGAAASLPFERPDIVIVMSESFWDPALLPGVTIEPDPIPTTRALRSGSVHSPEFGGMTANAEFEALTGFSNAFLPYGSIPYQQYVRDDVPSLASFLRDEGYRTLAMHPFVGWFWNRAHVYEAFGFEEFLSEETLANMEKRGPLASDASLTEEIIRQVDDSSEPAFIFAVSLQGHGPYEPDRYPDSPVTVAAPVSDWARGSIRTFVEGAADADRGLARLVDWAKGRQRPTVIVFFGDHLPPLGPVYVETGFIDELVAPRKGPADLMARVRETPLVVWSNRDGVVQDTGSVSPAFLPLLVLGAADIEHPYYTGFLGAVHERFRVVDRHLLVDADGKAAQDWSRGARLDPLIRDYRLVQHDLLFGKRYGAERFFNGSPPDQGPPVASGTTGDVRPAPSRRGRVFPPA